MSMKPHGLEPIPEETRQLVERLCPKGTMITQLRDELGPIYSDEQFAHLFPHRGRPAEAPWRLALVTWLQAHLNPQWCDRYVHRFELARFPKAQTQRQQLRQQVGQDVAQLLACLEQVDTPQGLGSLPEVGLLRQIFAQHYEQEGEQIRWRDGPAVSNEERIVSPYDQEARSSRKRDLVWLGYKGHVT